MKKVIDEIKAICLNFPEIQDDNEICVSDIEDVLYELRGKIYELEQLL